MAVNNKGNNPSKKRKIGDDGEAVPDRERCHDFMRYGGGFISSWLGYFSRPRVESSSAISHEENNTTQLNRMEQMMIRMEDKLNAVEKRCEQLEAKCNSLDDKLESKCSSLESKLETQLHSVKDHVEKLEGKVDTSQLSLDYNAMILRNQSWEYSAEVKSEQYWVSRGYDRNFAGYLELTAEELRQTTTVMRQGKFSCNSIRLKLIDVFAPEINFEDDLYDDELRPHWEEFAAALKQFSPAINMLPAEFETSFKMANIILNYGTSIMIKDALIGVPFTSVSYECMQFDNGEPIDAYIAILETNQQLRRLDIRLQSIHIDDIERFCSAVHNHNSLVELDLHDSMDDSETGNAMIRGLLAGGDLKLEALSMEFTNISSDVSSTLADVLATNPKLTKLDLTGNLLTDDDAALIANALRHNTTLRQLYLGANRITSSGLDAFRPVLCDNSSLNAVADSNHCCRIPNHYGPWNSNTSSIKENRQKKIYALLSSRHVSGSLNVQHFSDIDVKVLPDMLEAVHKYSMPVVEPKVGCLSIVYEVMRKWEKVFNLYQRD